MEKPNIWWHFLFTGIVFGIYFFILDIFFSKLRIHPEKAGLIRDALFILMCVFTFIVSGYIYEKKRKLSRVYADLLNIKENLRLLWVKLDVERMGWAKEVEELGKELKKPWLIKVRIYGFRKSEFVVQVYLSRDGTIKPYVLDGKKEGILFVSERSEFDLGAPDWAYVNPRGRGNAEADAIAIQGVVYRIQK